ncbi:hypothetical protein QJS10_CPA09g01517 [Acorus calamus]|uniref:Uncharacterized protein n=1 Tax=Acorus calamus TaxID=4465 RepID=A0AAV9E8Q1_ACOCL|nr:hypothetical protein QJS10_CPA09g01517 [Acorus calamus]
MRGYKGIRNSNSKHQVQQPVLTYPGTYRRVTVELKVSLFFLQILHITEIDKVHLLSIHDASYSCFPGQSPCCKCSSESNLVDEMDGGALLGLDHDMYTGSAVN